MSARTRWFAVHSACRTAQLVNVGDSKISTSFFRISATMMWSLSFMLRTLCSARPFACGRSIGEDPMGNPSFKATGRIICTKHSSWSLMHKIWPYLLFITSRNLSKSSNFAPFRGTRRAKVSPRGPPPTKSVCT